MQKANLIASIILAGGRGSRMQSDLPKVLHKVGGIPMVGHVVDACPGADQRVVIVGHGALDVQAYLKAHGSDVVCVKQEEPLGTGHAALQAEKALGSFVGDGVILSGDVPLVTPALIQALLKEHQQQGNVVTVLTTQVDEPTGLGRIVRGDDGLFQAIVEEKDAMPDEREITEINTGIYAVRLPALFALLKHVSNDNAAGEFYITSIITIALGQGQKVGTIKTDAGAALLGVNTPEQLAQAERLFTQKHSVAAKKRA